MKSVTAPAHVSKEVFALQVAVKKNSVHQGGFLRCSERPNTDKTYVYSYMHIGLPLVEGLNIG